MSSPASFSASWARTVQAKTGSEYYARVQAMPAADLERGLAHQVWELSWTQDRKLRWLRWAFWTFGSCLAATLIGVVWVHLPCVQGRLVTHGRSCRPLRS